MDEPVRPVVLSVNVGMPADVPWKNTTVHTGIYKRPVDGPRMVRRLNVDGDGQGDLGGHGGEQRAVLVYQQGSYEHWSQHFGGDDLTPGSFGENFTVSGLPDDEVFIGDRYRIGEAVFEVTQPRVTCFRVGMRLGEPQLPSLLVAHRRPGFYLRVLAEGLVQAGDAIVKVADGPHRLSVAAIDGLLYLPDRSEELLRKAVDIPALSPGWQQSFHELLAAAESGEPIAAPEIGLEPGWAGFRPFTVIRTVRETPTVLSVHLSAARGETLPVPKPGQYLTIRLPVDGVPAVRSYSISGQPDPSTYRISVKREEHGSVSGYLHEKLTVGSVIEVAAPRGDFVLADGDGPVVFLSAGIGITPVLAMLASLASRAATRPVWWLHVARTEEDYALATEVDSLLRTLPGAMSCVYLTRTGGTASATRARTVLGRLDADRLSQLGLPTDADAYVCGPSGFISGMTTALTELGLAPAGIHSELFGTLAPLNPGVAPRDAVAPHPPAGPVGTGPAVTFARSGLTVNWSEAYPSLLELAEACDVPTRWSCRTGVCHNCITGALSGTISYSPQPLEQPGPAEVLLCCSRPETDLVLDA